MTTCGNLADVVGQNGNIPNHPMQYSLSLLSVPSHCTMGQIGHNGKIPKHLMQDASFAALNVTAGRCTALMTTSNSVCVVDVHCVAFVCYYREGAKPSNRHFLEVSKKHPLFCLLLQVSPVSPLLPL